MLMKVYDAGKIKFVDGVRSVKALSISTLRFRRTYIVDPTAKRIRDNRTSCEG